MIKAVIFDCFGVLTTDGWLPFVQKYFGDDKLLLQTAHDLNKQCDSRLLGYEEFVKKVSEMAHLEPYEARAEIQDNVANQPLFDYILSLKSKYKIGMLSNAASNWLQELFSPEQVALFDEVVLSCDVGTTKPNERMYEMIAEKLGVEPSECVFTDDSERYVTGAKDVGMQGITYKEFASFKTQLDQLLN